MITPKLWRKLSDEEEKDFREHARKTYHAGEQVSPLWHPVYIHEIYLINKEAGILDVEEL